MDKLTGRQNQILKYFYRSNERISSEFLSTSVGVSTKTIKKEVQIITPIVSKYGANITSKTGMGYLLIIEDRVLFEKFLKFNNDNNSAITSLPFIYQRAHYIIRRILSSDEAVTINQLSEELFTSRTTINSDLIMVKDILSTYSINLISKPHYGLKYKGKESNIRSCLIDEFKYYEINNLFVEESDYYDYFDYDEDTVQKIREIIYEQQRNVDCLEISYQNIILLVRMILISVKRNKNDDQSLYSDDELYTIKTKPSFKVAKQILNSCSLFLGHQFNTNDVCMLAIYIVCYRNYSTQGSVLSKDIYYKRYRLAEEIVNYLCSNNYFSLLDGDVTLISSLALHLMPLINRCQFRIKLPNIETITIKQNSISSIELATQAAYYLKTYHNLNLSEDEVVFLAYVFHPTFGRYNRSTKRKNILLVNSVDKNVGKGIAERLKRNFDERIGIIKLCDYYELKPVSYEEFDILVTDIDMESLKDIPLPILKLDSFFKQNIKSDIKDILSMRKFNFEAMIGNFKEEVFFTYSSVESKTDFFKKFYSNISKKYNFDKVFFDKLILRDEISSIEDGNKVAFMKTLNSELDDSFISVNILDKPITWKYEVVQIIIIAHIGKNDLINSEFFENGYFGNVIKTTFFKQENIMKLLRYQNYDTLLEVVKQRVNLPIFFSQKTK